MAALVAWLSCLCGQLVNLCLHLLALPFGLSEDTSPWLFYRHHRLSLSEESTASSLGPHFCGSFFLCILYLNKWDRYLHSDSLWNHRCFSFLLFLWRLLCLPLLILPPECFLFNPRLAPGCCRHALLGVPVSASPLSQLSFFLYSLIFVKRGSVTLVSFWKTFYF